jgi:hypothetical protein
LVGIAFTLGTISSRSIILSGGGRHIRERSEVRHGRARKYVRRACAEDVRDQDAWVGIAVRARESYGLVRSAGLGTADHDLRAGRVELGATLGLGEVERDDLLSDEVAARRDICRERQSYGTAVH